MMKEYGVTESWTKFTINHGIWLLELCLLAEDEFLFRTKGNVEGAHQDKLVAYNPEKKTLRDMVAHGIPSKF